MPLLLLRLANALSFFGISYKHTTIRFHPSTSATGYSKVESLTPCRTPAQCRSYTTPSHHVPQQPLLYPTLMRILLLILPGCNPLKRIRAFRLIQLHHPPILGHQAPLQRLKLHTNKQVSHPPHHATQPPRRQKRKKEKKKKRKKKRGNSQTHACPSSHSETASCPAHGSP